MTFDPILAMQAGIALFLIVVLQLGWWWLSSRWAGDDVEDSGHPPLEIGVRIMQLLLAAYIVITALDRLTSLEVWAALEWVRAGMNKELVNLAGTPLTAMTAITVMIVFVGSWSASVAARKGIERLLTGQQIGDPGTIGALARLGQYLLMGIGVAIGLNTLGLNLSALFAAGAMFAVGIGLAMQQIAENFVSGVILLVERTIRPGDVLEVNGEIIRVQHLGIRATVARTLDDEEVILPNSLLVQNPVKNLKLSDPLLRVRVVVGVAYDSDLRQVMESLRRAALHLPKIGGREPVVVLKQFGSSSVDFEVSVWTDDPWRGPLTYSNLALEIWDELHADGVVIAFPQMDVHFDPGFFPVRETA